MSANFELLCAYSPMDDDDDDLPLFHLRSLDGIGEKWAALWKRLTGPAGNGIDALAA